MPNKCGSCGSVQQCGCGECHKCGYGGMKYWGGIGVNTTAGSPARTQKGLGLGVLRAIYFNQVLKVLSIAQKEEDLSHATWPAFCRPCPSTPKHGYIDSRVCANLDEAKALLAETLADDPNGEMMVTPFIKANYNVIWTPGSLVIGTGHDGATAGKNTVTVPLAGKNPFDADQLKAAKVAADGWPYVEAVLAKKGPYSGSPGPGSLFETTLTQLRAGPKIEGHGGDYIPHLVEVEKVLKADPKLYKDRDWEVLIDKLAGDSGTVVWHPGGAMTDHFSIHAFTHQIPIIFGDTSPKVGDVLEPLEGHADATFDPIAMLKGVIAGDRYKISRDSGKDNAGEAIYTLLTALHNATVMTGEDSKWIGFAAAIMLKAGVTALRGEARHLSISGKTSPSREKIYQLSFGLKLGRHRASVNSLVNLFRYGAWQSAGFGGIKWAMCGAATVELFEAVRKLAVDPTEKSAAAMVRALNVAVNQAHNGGWWLNKFSNASAFDAIQNGHLPFMISSTPVFYVGDKIVRSLKPALVEAEIAKIAKWPETTLKPPKVISVKMTYQPGIEAIGLKLTTRLLKDKSKLILAPASKILEAFEGLVGDSTYLVETNDGFRVEIRSPDKGTFVLWEDEKLAEKAEKFTDAKLAGK